MGCSPTICHVNYHSKLLKTDWQCAAATCAEAWVQPGQEQQAFHFDSEGLRHLPWEPNCRSTVRQSLGVVWLLHRVI